MHMIELGHTKMLHEGVALAEYADFYDYSASYPDHEVRNRKIFPVLLKCFPS